MSLQYVSLLSQATLQVDFIQAGRGARRLACTFTPFNNRTLEGVGYAGEFLLKRGFDIIAFKSSADDWYQSLLPDDLAQIFSFIAQRDYRECVGYGSSMGGFAAIAFSGELGLHRVLAYSPQFRIDRDFDQRWKSCLDAIPMWRHDIGAPTRAEVFIVYDNFSKDALHAAMIREALPVGAVREARLPFSGHPCAHFLHETGQLQALAEAFLSGNPVPRINREMRTQSIHYCKSVAWAALRHHHFVWAATAVEQALQLAPADHEALALKKRIRSQHGRWRLRYPLRQLQAWLRRMKN